MAILHQTELSFELKPKKRLPKKWQKWQILSDDICKLFLFLFLLFYVEDYGGAGGQGAASHKTVLKSLILYIYTYT
jgi:hypothetical protein